MNISMKKEMCGFIEGKVRGKDSLKEKEQQLI